MFRIGHGFDLHRFEDDKPLKLGGVPIPYHQGMSAHSDGDVVLHALSDALLGAGALGDIGQHFPDTDADFKNADSTDLLVTVYRLIAEHQWQVNNVDITIQAEKPKLSPYREAMREHIAKTLSLSVDQVSVKATTMEGCGEIGRAEAIATHAVVLLSRVE